MYFIFVIGGRARYDATLARVIAGHAFDTSYRVRRTLARRDDARDFLGRRDRGRYRESKLETGGHACRSRVDVTGETRRNYVADSHVLTVDRHD